MPLKNNEYSAILLAAGKGSRLNAITSNPKSLLPVSGRSFLEHHLDNLNLLEITEIIVVVGYKKELVTKHLEKYGAPLNIVYVDNEDYIIKGNAYSLYLGIKAASKRPIILDADFICEKAILRSFAKDSKEDALLVGPGSLEDIECTKVIIDSNSNVRQTIDKRGVTKEELKNHSFAGEAMGAIKLSINGKKKLIKTSAEFFNNESNLCLNWEHLLNQYFKEHSMGIHYVESNNWVEVDTPEDYEEAKRKFE